jgi:glycosyltransferase involved in cell wall biosynthesis
MGQGAFPIQTSTACLEGWIEAGITGYVVDRVDPESLAKQVLNVLLDDKLVLRAQSENLRTIHDKYSKTTIENLSLKVYSQIIS